MSFAVTEHTAKSARHTTGYLACGVEEAPLLIFVHGWPELSLSWRAPAQTNVARILDDFRDHRDELVISTKSAWDMWPGPYGDLSCLGTGAPQRPNLNGIHPGIVSNGNVPLIRR
jgi:pimeloyl-ACP methyl ester carboxylesterase